MEEPVLPTPRWSNAEADARAAQALATLAAYRQWRVDDLPAGVASALDELDRQQLMTAAAVCLTRVARGDTA
ncbi:MAG: hypothetical protein AAFX76_05475 [Planctomycetota bacterium]